MGIRTDKGKALTRYVLGNTGIPFMSWNGAQGQIDAPAPYHLDVVTSRKLDNWHSHLRLENPGIYASIRYDNNIDDVSQAWVGMHLSDFVVLLKAHYETIEDRIKGE